MKRTTRAQAIALGLTRYYTGMPCIHGHLCERMVTNYTCIDCMRTGYVEPKTYPAMREAAKKRWAGLSEDKRNARLAGVKRAWANTTPEQRQAHADTSARNRRWEWASMSPEKRAERIASMQAGRKHNQPKGD